MEKYPETMPIWLCGDRWGKEVTEGGINAPGMRSILSKSGEGGHFPPLSSDGLCDLETCGTGLVVV